MKTLTKAQSTRALALLRSISSDIESMRSDSGDDYFGGFSGSCLEEDGLMHVEWPNLSITGRAIAAFLKGVS